MKERIPIERESLVAFCRHHHIRRLSLFGSVLKGMNDSDSDVDLLVEFERGYAPGFIGLAGMERELSELAGGEKFDLRTLRDLSRYFRDDVAATAEVQYAE